MVTSELLYLGLLGGIAAERLAELRRSRRHARLALARGAREAGREHFPVMAAVHAAFLPACAVEVMVARRSFPGVLGWAALGGVAVAQGLRAWAVSTLGPRWNVRVLVIPGEAPVATGPYRFVRHPNYVAVALEMACVPLVHGAWLTAALASAANAALLAVRVRVEERALGPGYRRTLGRLPRFLPRRGAR